MSEQAAAIWRAAREGNPRWMRHRRALDMVDADVLATIRAGWRWDVFEGGEKVGSVWAVNALDARGVVETYFNVRPQTFEVRRACEASIVSGGLYIGGQTVEGEDVEVTEGTPVLYLAIAWERATGVWLEAVNLADRRNVSERAIDRTYHRFWMFDELTPVGPRS